jgi:hypothetical protein
MDRWGIVATTASEARPDDSVGSRGSDNTRTLKSEHATAIMIPFVIRLGSVESFNLADKDDWGTPISRTAHPSERQNFRVSLKISERSSVHITVRPNSWP